MKTQEINQTNDLTINLKHYATRMALLTVLGSGMISMSHAQDNPIPSFWGGVNVQVTETYGNNFTKPLMGAYVTIDLKDPAKAAATLRKFPTLKFPVRRTTGTRGADFRPIPPTRDVGDYIITVVPKPNDKNKEYACTPNPKKRGYTVGAYGEITEKFRMGASGTNRRNYGYKCPRADTVNEFNRRKQGGYELTVDVQQGYGTRGNRLWVAVYDSNNRRLKWVGTGGNHQAKFRAVDPQKGPYRIVVHANKNDNKPLYEATFKMPNENVSFTAKITKNGNNQQGGNKPLGNNQNQEPKCHEVRIQAQGKARQHGYIKAQACKQDNGYWEIEPYKYKR